MGLVANGAIDWRGGSMSDPVNNPAHYTYGRVETIDVFEQVVDRSPNCVWASLQWQVLKYLLRMWHKENPLQDAKKAQWYLNRLIQSMENNNDHQ